MKLAFVFSAFILLSLHCYPQKSLAATPVVNDSILGEHSIFLTTDSLNYYFPVAAFRDSGSPTGDQHKAFMYSSPLFYMKEPKIYQDKSNNEVYRFLWIRSFDDPIAIRLEKNNDQIILFWRSCKLTDHQDQASPIVVSRHRKIDNQTWLKFLSLLNDIDFFTMSSMPVENKVTDDEYPEVTVDYLDGADWILEGKKGENYHVVTRNSPDKESKYFKCCDFLINMTDLKIEPRDKY
jgi:hypothetical protein